MWLPNRLLYTQGGKKMVVMFEVRGLKFSQAILKLFEAKEKWNHKNYKKRFLLWVHKAFAF